MQQSLLLTCFGVYCDKKTAITDNQAIDEAVKVDVYKIAIMFLRFCMQLSPPQLLSVVWPQGQKSKGRLMGRSETTDHQWTASVRDNFEATCQSYKSLKSHLLFSISIVH
jgi:hypothetical protein